MIITNIKKHWYWAVMLMMLIAIYVMYKNREVPQNNEQNVILNLRDSVNTLKSDNIKLIEAYENKQTTIIENIIVKNEKNAKDISSIPNLDNAQRDQLWAGYSTKEDSLPTGYWRILYEKTGGRSPKELGVQGSIQK